MSSTSGYHEEGWLYDFGEARRAVISLVISVSFFVMLIILSGHHPPPGKHPSCVGTGAGTVCGSGTDALGFLLSALTFVGSATSIGVGLFSASEGRHRVRLIARSCVVLSAANLVAFCIFIATLSA